MTELRALGKPENLLTRKQRRELLEESRQLVEAGLSTENGTRGRYDEIQSSTGRDMFARMDAGDAAGIALSGEATSDEQKEYLVGAQRLLREGGTPAELERAMQACQAASDGLMLLRRSRVCSWADGCVEWIDGEPGAALDAIEDHLEQLYRILDGAKVEAERAVVNLKAAGAVWSSGERWAAGIDGDPYFNRSDPGAVVLGNGGAGRRQSAFARAVERLAEMWQLEGNTAENRRIVALAFEGIFPVALLSAKSCRKGGELHSALGNYFRRLTRAEIQRRKAAATSN